MQTVVIFLPITLLDWNIFFVMTNEFVRWTDNLALIYQLLDPVCRPAGDTGDCKNRCKDLDWQLQHCIHKSAVEIDIRANRLECTAMLTDQLRCDTLNSVIQCKLILQAFLLGKLLRILLQDYRSWIGLTINRVSHTIDQSRMVEALLVKESLQIL